MATTIMHNIWAVSATLHCKHTDPDGETYTYVEQVPSFYIEAVDFEMAAGVSSRILAQMLGDKGHGDEVVYFTSVPVAL